MSIKLSPLRIELTASLLEKHAAHLRYQKREQLEFIKRFDKDDLGRTPILKIIHRIENEIAETENFRDELDALKFDAEVVKPKKVRESRKRKEVVSNQ